jgi:hypothetical protein
MFVVCAQTQAVAPSCPSNWWKYASTGKCYYQSTVQADFETARKVCRFMANGGDVARVTAEEAALVLTPDFWRNSPSDKGSSTFTKVLLLSYIRMFNAILNRWF